MTVFVFLGRGFPSKMIWPGRYKVCREGECVRRPARGGGSGTFALSCTFVSSTAVWDRPGSLSLWSPTPQPVRRRLTSLCSGQTLQPQEGGNTKAISSPSLPLCGSVYSLGSDDRDRIELWMTAGLRAVNLSAREGGRTPACWFCLQRPGPDAVQNLYL